MKPKVSVIIPTFNEERNIDRCLESIASQTYRNLEIILVDDGSTDKTVKIAQGWQKKLNLKIFPRKRSERSKTRNFGAKKSSGKYLLFLDTDMELEKEVVTECFKAVRTNPQVKAVAVTEAVPGLGKTFWNKCLSLEMVCYIGESLIEAARFFERKIFENLQGFDEKLIAAEDWDLTARIRKSGFKIGRTKSFVIHHKKEINLWQMFKKKYYYGLNLSLYIKKQPKLSIQQWWSGRLLIFWRKRKLLASHPLLTLGMFFIKFCEYAGGGSGILVSKFLPSSLVHPPTYPPGVKT